MPTIQAQNLPSFEQKTCIDNLFNNDVNAGSFAFGKDVSEVFHNMASRSIPGYYFIQSFITQYINTLINHQNSNVSILDIGCSVGYTLACVSEYAKKQNVNTNKTTVYASDVSPDMLHLCKQNLQQYQKNWKDILYVECDISNSEKQKHILHKTQENNQKLVAVICNFVLQFLPLQARKQVLSSLWDTLAPGGIIIIGEKFCSTNKDTQKIWDAMHIQYKKQNNYTETQIALKKKALQGVLIESSEEEFFNLVKELPHVEIENFYSWAAFHCYVLRKAL